MLKLGFEEKKITWTILCTLKTEELKLNYKKWNKINIYE